MSKNTVVVPKTAAAARKRISEIDTLENLGRWEKAAICYAYRAKHYDEIGDARKAAKAAADELATNGYSDWTITTYANRWAGAGLPDIRPGDKVEIPDIPWESITGGVNGSSGRGVDKRMTEMVVEAAKTDPEIAKVMADAIVKDDDDLDFTIERAIDKSREEHLEENGVTPVSKSERREADSRSIQLVRSITDVLSELDSLSRLVTHRIETDPEFTAGVREGFYKKHVAQLEGYHDLLKSQLTGSNNEGSSDWDKALADLTASREGGE